LSFILKQNYMRKLIILSILFILSTKAALAQQDQMLYFMPNIYQSNYVNPSFKPNNTFGIQFLSQNFTFLNNGFTIQDIHNNKGNIGPVIDGLPDILSLRFRVKSLDFTLSANEIFDTKMAFPKDLFALGFYGNGGDQFLANNRAADLSNFKMDFMLYHEFGLGVAYTKNKWSYGVRYKYLIGVANFNTAKSDLSIYTNPNDYSITAKSTLEFNTTGLPSLNSLADKNTISNYSNTDNLTRILKSTGNTGHAVDLGITYKYSEKFTFSASAINIGAINWKTDVGNYKNNNVTATIKGEDVKKLADSLNPSAIVDTLKSKFKLQETHDKYTTWLSPTVYLSGQYNLNKNNKIGLLYTAEYYMKVRSAYTFAYTKTFGRWWDLGFSYSIYDNSYNNFGVASGLRIGPFQTFIVTDNLVGALDPKSTKHVNVRLGLNFVFGVKPKNKTPDLASGTVGKSHKFKDRDNDGVEDSKDLCPDTPGSITANGCPDADNDSVPDAKDLCPTIKGLVKFNGCPDTDGDGIDDSKDACPDIKGVAWLKGCPDADGDSIPDAQDACPSVKGLRMYSGCPDSDGDGIIDSKDECPYLKGLLIYNGCPDTDGDSIPDNKDSCITVAGPRSNKGCPVLKAEPIKAQLSVEEQEVVNKVFSNLEFENGKAVIKKESFISIDGLIELLKKKTTFKLTISGYTDNVGKDEMNLKLSEDRANAVKEYIVRNGIAAERIKAEGFGKANPIAPNDTPEGKAKNRRVEFSILE
jgi:outer membrane protein OmpA-like peptidoglycan-associated protein